MPAPADRTRPRPAETGELPRLEALVRRARRRIVVAKTSRRLIVVAAQAGWLFLALVLLERLAGAGPVGAWSVATAAAAIGALLAVAATAASAPGPQDVARRLDRVLGTRQLFSTAREAAAAARSAPYGEAMRRLLVRRAEERAAEVEVRRVAPLRPGRRHLVVLASAVAAVAGAVAVDARVPVPAAPVTASVADAPVDIAPERRDPTATELERLAAAVEREAERRRDPYLGALAEASRELAGRIRSGDATADAASRELASLLDHLGDALGPAVRPEPVAAGPEASSDARAELPSDPPGDPTGLGDAVDLAEAFARALERVQASRSPSLAASLYLDSATMAEALREERSLGAAPGEAGGAPAGAAQNSTDAPGDAAGEGTHALTGDEEEASAATFESRDDVALPEAGAGADGARVRALGDVDPDEAGGVFAGGGSGASDAPGPEDALPAAGTASPARREAGDWRRAALDPAARRLAGRLFAPDAVEAER